MKQPTLNAQKLCSTTDDSRLMLPAVVNQIDDVHPRLRGARYAVSPPRNRRNVTRSPFQDVIGRKMGEDNYAHA